MAGTEVERRAKAEAAQVISPETARVFAGMVTQIPTEDGNGAENILKALLTAESLDDLNAPWESTDAKKLAGKLLRFNSVIQRPSDYQGGLGVFLVCFVTDTATGEDEVYTTGSVSTMAQIVRAYLLGLFPFFAEVIISERPTKEGFHPHHLLIKGSAAIPAQAENVEA